MLAMESHLCMSLLDCGYEFLAFHYIYIRNIVEPLTMMFEELLAMCVGHDTHFAMNIEMRNTVQNTLAALTRSLLRCINCDIV